MLAIDQAVSWNDCNHSRLWSRHMSSNFSQDPIQNIIFQGMKAGIDACMEAGCHRSALVLIYSAIDTMAYLTMPSNQQRVTRRDFIAWCDNHLRLHGETTITGLEWYSARCAVVHSFGIESDLTLNGTCRQIGYSDKDSIPVRFRRNVSSDLVMVSLASLVEEFGKGVNRSIIETIADPQKRLILDSRLQNQLLSSIPINMN